MKKFNVPLVNYFLIPANLPIDELITNNKPNFKCKPDKIAYIVNLMYEIPAHNKRYRDLSEIPINTRILRKSVDDYPDYMNYLVDNNVLYTDYSYTIGEKSRCYSITPDYHSELVPYYITDFTMLKKINKHTQYLKFDHSSSLLYLSKWFNDKLEINFDEAVKYNNSLYEININESPKNAYNKYASYFYNIEHIKRKNFRFFRDDTSFRLHTNLTTLKKDFRKFITYDGQPLCSYDFANSQPYLATPLFNLDFYDCKSNIYNLFNASPKIYNEIIKNKKCSKEIFNILQEDSLFARNDKDYHSNADFIEKAQEGLIYDYIEDAIFDSTGYRCINRDELKSMLFMVFYSDNSFLTQDKAKNKLIFKNTFPGVYNAFKFIKKGNNARLPILLQTMESQLVIDNIAKTIAKAKPDLPIFTVHDSIVTLPGYDDLIYKIMKEESIKLIGIPPKIKYDFPWK